MKHGDGSCVHSFRKTNEHKNRPSAPYFFRGAKIIKKRLVAFGMLVVVLSGLVVFNLLGDDKETVNGPNTGHNTQDPAYKGDPSEAARSEEIAAYISRTHDFWNRKLGWGRYKAYDFNEFHRNYEMYTGELNQMIEVSEDEYLKHDLTQAKEYLEDAKTDEDIQSLIYVHRIFHELDVFYNGYDSEQYWGISEYAKNNNRNRN
ncbi:MAG TPA: hypothetical protein VNM69_11210 [Bacillus sp. (in: firmicutes)]|uniref:hypothetical protein n=1 Tax=Bacillus litorisediminis TaxID=2922713 RepID=UPI001FB021F3|nr:hypothetical protein [Bacillus litorisediminis]HWO76446.1 hypothetical protein [Bacillus sp. (in: firmicutes)]